mgnify:FL=1
MALIAAIVLVLGGLLIAAVYAGSGLWNGDFGGVSLWWGCGWLCMAGCLWAFVYQNGLNYAFK